MWKQTHILTLVEKLINPKSKIGMSVVIWKILKVNKLSECFTKNNYKKKNQKEFRVEKVTKRKYNKLYAK